MNLGLSSNLNLAFPNIVPTVRPVVQSIKNIDPNWLAGFVSGEGNLFVRVADGKTKAGKQVVLMFSISQHSKDADLLRAICDYLGCGAYYPRTNRDEGNIVVTKFSDIDLKILPHFSLNNTLLSELNL